MRHALAADLLSGTLFSLAATLAERLRPAGTPSQQMRMQAAVLLGPGALAPRPGERRATRLAVLLLGLGLHQGFMALNGLLFAALMQSVRPHRARASAAIAGPLYTLVVWPLCYYAVAPRLGWWWFARRTSVPRQLVLQVGVWGGTLGAAFARGPGPGARCRRAG